MKKPHICTVIGSSGRGYVLIILFALYCSMVGFLIVIYSGLVNSMTPNLYIGRKANPILI